MELWVRDTAISEDAIAKGNFFIIKDNFFYKQGCLYALNKLGASLMQPTDQTYQIHREVDSPAHNGPDGKPADEVDSTPETTQALWNEHDRRTQLSALLNTDTRVGP